MAQAKHSNTTIPMRASQPRLTVIRGGRKPKSSIMQLIDKLAADLAAGGPMFPDAVQAPGNPYVNHYGKISDPEKAAQWEMAQRKGGAK